MTKNRTKAPELSIGCSNRGAHMGRPAYLPNDFDPEQHRLHLGLMPIDSGGYDQGGAYWGLSTRKSGRMYRAWAQTPSDVANVFVRAQSRDEARTLVESLIPEARFYR